MSEVIEIVASNPDWPRLFEDENGSEWSSFRLGTLGCENLPTVMEDDCWLSKAVPGMLTSIDADVILHARLGDERLPVGQRAYHIG